MARSKVRRGSLGVLPEEDFHFQASLPSKGESVQAGKVLHKPATTVMRPPALCMLQSLRKDTLYAGRPSAFTSTLEV